MIILVIKRLRQKYYMLMSKNKKETPASKGQASFPVEETASTKG